MPRVYHTQAGNCACSRELQDLSQTFIHRTWSSAFAECISVRHSLLVLFIINSCSYLPQIHQQFNIMQTAICSTSDEGLMIRLSIIL